MPFIKIQHVPEPDFFIAELPVPEALRRVKAERDRLITEVLEGKNDKLLMVVGPCSADNQDSVCDYVSRLGRLQEQLCDKLVLVPRIYTNKPRSTGEGY